MQAAGFCLSERFAHDFGRNTRDLYVHLETGDAVFRSRDFKIHIAQVIFFAEDIGKDFILFVFRSVGDEPHRDARDHLFHRHTGGKQRKTTAASRRL